jgi:predicted phage terminase large subunit-like protein
MQQATQGFKEQQTRSIIDGYRRRLGVSALKFPEWLPTVTPHWTWNWKHQIALYKKLADVTSGKTKRLMIFMPPRHSKSETVTVRYMAYRIELDPTMTGILGSYNQKLANRFSRKIRRIVKPRVRLAKDSNAIEEWETAAGGAVRAVGVGAGITGYGAKLICIDDPIKNRKEAESITYRDNVAEWFADDLYTRLEPDGAIILTLTRWHDDDLAGRLIREMETGGEKWEILSLPALAEEDDPLGRDEGDALCPERYDEERLLAIKKKLGAYSFSALYQQSPTPREGLLFKADWFKTIDVAPPNLKWKRGYDLAVETKTQNDETASYRVAFDAMGNMYIDGGFCAKIEAPEQQKYMLERFKAERNTEHLISKTLHGSSFIQSFRRLPAVRGVAFKGINERGDKYTRALAWANRAEEGRVYLVKGGWNDDLIAECLKFTGSGKAGEKDNRIDAISIAVQGSLKRSGKLLGF